MNDKKLNSHPAAGIPVLALMFASGAGLLLVALRVAWTRDVSYLFLIWNLFLAWLPLIFALRVRQCHDAGEKIGARFCFLAGMWLLFFPNAPYIFTDLIHLNYWFRQHYWVDFSLILQFALTGFLLGFISLYLMQSVVAQRFGRTVGWLFTLGAAGLSGVGVCVGRFLRWNSWDIVTNPLAIAEDLGHWVSHPVAHSRSVAFAMLFATFSFISYVMLYGLTHLQPVRDERLGGG